MPRKLICLACLLGVVLVSACAQYENKRGVDVDWHSGETDRLVKGKTTRGAVLDWLGPPSQLISLGDETVLYYLFERSAGNGLVLIVYNRFQVDTRYDRAIFFFDDNDVLTDYSTRAGAVTDG